MVGDTYPRFFFDRFRERDSAACSPTIAIADDQEKSNQSLFFVRLCAVGHVIGQQKRYEQPEFIILPLRRKDCLHIVQQAILFQPGKRGFTRT